MAYNAIKLISEMKKYVRKMKEKLNTLDICGLNYDEPYENTLSSEDVDYRKFIFIMDQYLDRWPENKEDFLELNTNRLLNARWLGDVEVFLYKLNLQQEQGEIPQNDIIIDTNKVFLVHGHDEAVKEKVARVLEKLGLEVVIISEKVNKGATIIEKIHQNTNVGYGIVLYTPCDEGRLCNELELHKRARQNVVFEHGYLMGKLGRDRVCALHVNEVEIPSDLSGILYIPMDSDWKIKLINEMNAVGFHLDKNNL